MIAYSDGATGRWLQATPCTRVQRAGSNEFSQCIEHLAHRTVWVIGAIDGHGDRISPNSHCQPGRIRCGNCTDTRLRASRRRAHTGIHHHGEQQTIAYVLSGICEVRWGARGEYDARAKAGDFIHVPAFLPHMEINPSDSEPFHWVVVRSTSTPIVMNLPGHTWPQPRHALAAGLPSLSS